jgi:hypothetical protein
MPAGDMALWPELKFPPLNLYSMPKHEVLVLAHGAQLAKEFEGVWDESAQD